jgi:hypothetical protein
MRISSADGRGSLFALVSFDLGHSAAADVAAQLIERWGGLFANAGSMSLVIFPSEEGTRPKTESAKAKGFFGEARCGSRLRARVNARRLRYSRATDGHIDAPVEALIIDNSPR